MSENNRLKKRVKDLKLTLHYQHQFQQNINDQISIFQCSECSKTFINDKYLSAHLKRRHNIDQKVDKENLESEENTVHTTPEHEKYKMETDRLQSEIKVLKEKLNNTERYFNSDNGNLSPEHGTVKIRRSSITNNERYDIKDLQKQFETLKDMVQTELNMLKTQKVVEKSQETLLQKVFDKLESNGQSNYERRNSYVQTDEVDSESVKSKSLVMKQKTLKFEDDNVKSRPVQKDKREQSSFIEIDSPMEVENQVVSEKVDIQQVQEKVEKKLEEKTKKEIEELGEQLSKKVCIFFRRCTSLYRFYLFRC